MVIVCGLALAVGGLAAIQSRNGEQTPASEGSDGVSLDCDNKGCHGFDDLRVVPGATDFYVGAESLGQPTIERSWFDTIVRCSLLSANGTTCEQVEGIAGVPLVSYSTAITVDTTTRSEGSFSVNIGTTFTEVEPVDYARNFDLQPDTTAAVRGHAAVRFTESDQPAIVWRERDGVLVWVTVPPEFADQLQAVAEGVRRADGPTTIPFRVVVPDTGRPFDGPNNNADALVVGRIGSVECVGYGFIGQCSQDIAHTTFLDRTPTGILIAGRVPSNVTAVRVSVVAGDFAIMDTFPSSAFNGRFYETLLDAPILPTIIEWLDASGGVVASATRPPADLANANLMPWPVAWGTPIDATIDTLVPFSSTTTTDSTEQP
jgi:hypothetical protein